MQTTIIPTYPPDQPKLKIRNDFNDDVDTKPKIHNACRETARSTVNACEPKMSFRYTVRDILKIYRELRYLTILTKDEVKWRKSKRCGCLLVHVNYD